MSPLYREAPARGTGGEGDGMQFASLQWKIVSNYYCTARIIDVLCVRVCRLRRPPDALRHDRSRSSCTGGNLSVTRAARVPFVAGTSLRSAPINFINPSAFAAWPALRQSHYPVYLVSPLRKEASGDRYFCHRQARERSKI